jgi:Fe-S oxidoreductase
MGQIQMWAKIASHIPALANFATRTPGLSRLTKWAGGIAPQRTMPRFASPTFRAWHAKHPSKAGERVILWPDTFNNYFRSGTAIAAAHVLEKLGFRVEIPREILCCGRPLYDWGWIERAKELWRRTMTVLREDIEAGVPIIGLEPACVSAFRDELPALFPNDPLAAKLSKQTRILSEFLQDRKIPLSFAKNATSRALVQLHCHHHAVLEKDAELGLLKSLPLACDVLDGGCCGMAGSFGFEAEKYELSMRIGERGILPRIREAGAGTAILADGFSCREQIEQATEFKTLHLAQLLDASMG